MKETIAVIVMAIAAALPGIFGLIPGWISIICLLVISILYSVIIAFMLRGFIWEAVMTRLFGGVLCARGYDTGQMSIKRKNPEAGMVHFSDNSYNLEESRIYRPDGVPLALIPERWGANMGMDHAQLVAELKRRGISNILEICDADDYGFFKNWKDDPRINDLKEQYTIEGKAKKGGLVAKPRGPVTLEGFQMYVSKAANPTGQKANIRLGVAQGLWGQGGNAWKWALGIGLGIVIVLLIILLFTGGLGGHGVENIRIITDSSGEVVGIPG